MHNRWFEDKTHLQLIFILALLSYFFLMFGNGLVSMTHPDEVFYMQSAKEMIHHGRWFTPMIFDEPQFEKPFLTFALLAAAIKSFGLTSFAGRFFPALFGMIGVGVVYWISWTLFRNKRQAFLAGLVLSSSFIYIALSRAVLTDMIFSIIVALSIGFFSCYFVWSKRKGAALMLGLFFSALAVLTKGILGATFPLTVLLFYSIYKKDDSFLRNKYFYFGIILFLIIVLPWHCVMYAQHGSWFLQEYFHNVHFRRLHDAEHARLNHWYFYPGLTFAGVLPWSLFWIPVIGYIYKAIRQNSVHKDKIVFLIVWIFSIYLYTQPAISKLASYIFPLFPAAAILIAHYLHEKLLAVEKGEKPRALKYCGWAMFCILIAVIIGGYIAANKYLDIIVSLKPVYVTSVLAGIVALGLLFFNLKNQYGKMVLSYTGISVTLLIMLFFASPYVESWVSCKEISQRLKALDKSDTVILASKFYVRGVRYYTDRPMAVIDIGGEGFWSPHPIPFLNKDEQVINFFKSQPKSYAVLKEGNVEDVERILKEKPFKIEKLDGIGGKYILRITSIEGVVDDQSPAR